MNTSTIIATEDRYQIPTYKKFPLALDRGEGIWVWDTDGRRYADFYGGHCVVPIGHSAKPVVDAIAEQAARLMFYSNVVYSPVRAEAAETLARLAPEGLQHVFFCNSGTEANETALKMARTFTGKTRVVAMTAGFHGRTLGSLIATEGAYRRPYEGILPETTFVPSATPTRWKRRSTRTTTWPPSFSNPSSRWRGCIRPPTPTSSASAPRATPPAAC